MSIELPLTRAVAILPHYHSRRNPQNAQITFQIQNAGSAELNQKICRNIFSTKFGVKNVWRWVTGSFNSHKQFRFGFQESVAKAVATAGFSVSDESSESDGAEKKEMLNLSMNFSDESKDIPESELGPNGGPDIPDGGGQGGTGHGGDGKDNNNGSGGGSEGNDGLLRGSEWWWWWKWQCAHKIRCSQIDKRDECTHHSLCLVESISEMVAVETIKSLQLAVPPVTELLSQLALGLNEIISFVVGVQLLFLFFLFDFPHGMSQVWYTSMGAILALFAVVPLVAISGFLLWRGNCDQQDDNIGNDIEDDSGSI